MFYFLEKMEYYIVHKIKLCYELLTVGNAAVIRKKTIS